MDNEKLKLILALLSGVVFSLVFILLAFILPINSPQAPMKSMDSELQKLSQSYKEAQPKLHPEQEKHLKEQNPPTK
jgi:hypothetical protein